MEEEFEEEFTWSKWRKHINEWFQARIEGFEEINTKSPKEIEWYIENLYNPTISSVRFYKIDLTSPLAGGELPYGKVYDGFLVGIDQEDRIVEIKYYYDDRISYTLREVTGENFNKVAGVLWLMIKKRKKIF